MYESVLRRGSEDGLLGCPVSAQPSGRRCVGEGVLKLGAEVVHFALGTGQWAERRDRWFLPPVHTNIRGLPLSEINAAGQEERGHLAHRLRLAAKQLRQ